MTTLPGITTRDPIAWDFFNPARNRDDCSKNQLLDKTIQTINTLHQQVETITGVQPDISVTPEVPTPSAA